MPTDDFLAAEGLTKGSMRLIDAEEAERLYAHMGPAREVSGGSAGNTAAGIAALGGRAGLHRPGRARPARRILPPRPDAQPASSSPRRAADVGEPTARSMILVTPDGHRTMNTFLGAAQHLPASALDEAQIRDAAAILYLEGYLWDPETPRYAMVRAIEVARAAGRKVAFTLSDTFCVDRHRDGFNALHRRRPDRHPVRQPGRRSRRWPACRTSTARSRRSGGKVETLVVTRSEDGALATRGRRAGATCRPSRSAKLVDTTGAGDLFAAGFLAGDSARARASSSR